MKKLTAAVVGLLACAPVLAENVSESDRIVCSPADVKLCFENGECFDANPWELGIPEFLIFDLKKKTISTTEASGLERTTEFTALERGEKLILMQGIENDRAFSFVVDASTGIMTASVARDGVSVSVFGACTDTDL